MHLEIPDFNQSFFAIINSEDWLHLQNDFTHCERIILFGNGGNLAVADHAAVDISRLTSKLGLCPGSGILASSLINDKGHDEWLRKWVEVSARGLGPNVMDKSLYIGISSSGKSENVVSALNYSNSIGARSWMLTASSINTRQSINFRHCLLNLDQYHSAEVMTLLLTYELIHSAGFNCPSISQGSADNATLFDFSV